MSDRNRILCEFRNKTKSIMGDSLKQMILYGSYARGDYGDNSDMDIMVLTELTDDRIIQIEDEIFDAAYDIELEYGVPISVTQPHLLCCFLSAAYTFRQAFSCLPRLR